ncbi:MAG: PIN domain-containing protein [Verrucomicrobia bacterium]|nr:PIN domain-containing protein [Verrucomicrobiota bacterium]
MTLWTIRVVFLLLCTLAGFAVGELVPELIRQPYAAIAGFGLGGLMIAVDEMLKGFSLRAFSAATFGLLLGSLIAWLIDRSELFKFAPDDTRWIIRLSLFLSFGYIGVILAMRSNKEDFSLVIPYVRFRAQTKAENLLLLDTNVIIDGRIAELIDAHFLEGIVVVPKFVLLELQLIADSPDPTRRARGRRGLEILNRIRQNPINEVKVHEADLPEEQAVDSKLLRLAQTLNARLITNDYNLEQVARLHNVPCMNLNALAAALKPAVLPGETLSLRVVREGKEKDQGVAYMPDGTMVVINRAQPYIGQSVQAQVQSLVQTGAGVIIFADLKSAGG